MNALVNLYRTARARFTGDPFISIGHEPSFHRSIPMTQPLELREGEIYLPVEHQHDVFAIVVGDQTVHPGQNVTIAMAVLTARGREMSEVMKLPYHLFKRDWRRDSNNTFYNLKQHRCLPL